MGCGSSTAQAEPVAPESAAAEPEVDPLEVLKDKIDDVIGSGDLARVDQVLSEVQAMSASKELGASLTLLLSYRAKLQAAAEPEPEPEPEPVPEAEPDPGSECAPAAALPSEFVHPEFGEAAPSPTTAAAEAQAAAVPADFVHPDFAPK